MTEKSILLRLHIIKNGGGGKQAILFLKFNLFYCQSFSYLLGHSHMILDSTGILQKHQGFTSRILFGQF